MRVVLICLFTVLGFGASFGQTINHNLSGGYIADGYDVVAYFSNKAVEGKSAYVLSYKGAKYRFSTETNKAKFKANAAKYAPMYGGWCAYAMGDRGAKVTIDPETFQIIDGKLYLFYNSWGNNTKVSWNKEGPVKLKKQADGNWSKIKYKK
jgi:YHS domain-containing protein